MAEPGSSPTGAPCWVELRTADLPRAKTFYGELFGWRLDDITATGHPGQTTDRRGYSVALKDDVAVAGITAQHPPTRVLTAGWATYLAVGDVDEAVSRVGAGGGTVTMEPVLAIDTAGIAAVLDPTGAAVGLWQADRRVGTTVANKGGRLAWIELLTDDVDAAVAFYQRVFGLTTKAVELAGRPWVSLHAGPGTSPAVAGVVGKLSAETPNHWNIYFACVDIDDTARRTVELGGSVLFGPAPTPFGPMAGIMDPEGARFSLWGSVAAGG